MIDAYSFGSITVSGKRYTSDIIVDDRFVIKNWWRKNGHKLAVADLEDVINKYKPLTIIIGTGYNGMMKISDEIKEFCVDKNIDLLFGKTTWAVKEYNKLCSKGHVVAGFHLTC